MRSTRDVVDNHLKSFGERNLNGILSDYAPGAILFTPQGPIKSAEAFRAFFPSADYGIFKTWIVIHPEAHVRRG
jgi:hypothetical protein